jgi:hypothetical protein
LTGKWAGLESSRLVEILIQYHCSSDNSLFSVQYFCLGERFCTLLGYILSLQSNIVKQQVPFQGT